VHLLVVKGVGHRLAHARVGEELGVVVPAKIEVDPFKPERLGVVPVKVRSTGLCLPLLRAEDLLLNIAGLQRQQGDTGFGDDAKPDFAEVGLLAHGVAGGRVPGLASLQHDLAADDALLHFVGAAGHGVALVCT
jgi:hypothetical protein